MPDNRPACWRWKPPTDATMERVRKMFSPEHWESIDELEKRRLLMAVWQRERCAVCGRKSYGSLDTDHDHETGLVRGYLCRSCNTVEGFGGGLIFAKYRERCPAVICGYVEYYFDPITHRFAKPRDGEVLA